MASKKHPMVLLGVRYWQKEYKQWPEDGETPKSGFTEVQIGDKVYYAGNDFKSHFRYSNYCWANESKCPPEYLGRLVKKRADPVLSSYQFEHDHSPIEQQFITDSREREYGQLNTRGDILVRVACRSSSSSSGSSGGGKRKQTRRRKTRKSRSNRR